VQVAFTRSASVYEVQRRNRNRTFAFLALGCVWIGCLGFWAVFLQVWAFHHLLLRLQPAHGLLTMGERAWRWGLWGAGLFVILWALLAAVIHYRSGDACAQAGRG
jgi:FtsH-binding integral membrane protein